jgi:hypothetical protein
MTAITPATSALSAAFGRFDGAASELLRASAKGDSKNLAGPIADAVQAKEAVGAGIAVLQVQARNTKALLDIKV